MKEDIKRTIEKMLPMILKGAAASREFNRIIPITGERRTLPLEGRDIDIAYYRAPAEHAPLFIGLHGGGFLFGGSAMDDELWTNVSRTLNVNVASVDYRLSPEAKDLDCLYDAYDSALYIMAHAGEFGFDPEHISVFGASAGGNLAAAFALLSLTRGDIRLDNQILLYPFLDGASDPDSKGEGSFTGILPLVMNYLHFSPDKAADPLLSPYYAPVEMLKGLPNSVVSYCENDNLRDESVKYCENMKKAGVRVSEMLAKGMPHGYMECGFKDVLNDTEKNMLGQNCEDLMSSGLLRRRSLETLDFIKKNTVHPSSSSDQDQSFVYQSCASLRN